MPGELPFNARVFIANFGKENYLWPECLSTPCIATLDDEDLRDYWMTGNRRGYIEHCLRTKLTVRGLKPNRALASRWFNVHTTCRNPLGTSGFIARRMIFGGPSQDRNRSQKMFVHHTRRCPVRPIQLCGVSKLLHGRTKI